LNQRLQAGTPCREMLKIICYFQGNRTKLL
jgi:hypothetical protein